jgi:hypothetical protein
VLGGWVEVYVGLRLRNLGSCVAVAWLPRRRKWCVVWSCVVCTLTVDCGDFDCRDYEYHWPTGCLHESEMNWDASQRSILDWTRLFFSHCEILSSLVPSAASAECQFCQ